MSILWRRRNLFRTPGLNFLWKRYASQNIDNKKLQDLRNIGIIAHIDAGKTTTTERMLYYSGKTRHIGNVDQGDTVTDFLPQERARGITIQSAAITFDWNKARLNLIDTPGHADFTFEVIRSVKILDGCVTILDAVAGVEAQTSKVWTQSAGVPKICFVNKMDRMGAGFSRTVKDIISKLKTRVVLVNIPVFAKDLGLSSKDSEKNEFVGVADVLNKCVLQYDASDADHINVIQWESIPNDIQVQMTKSREAMVETLSELDSNLVEYVIDNDIDNYMDIPPPVLHSSIRTCTLNNTVSPVLCGASFKNIGVQPLLDSIVSYLPSPCDVPKLPEITRIDNKPVPLKLSKENGLIVNNNNNLCLALAFKVINDPIRGPMVFLRVYSGTLKSGNTVYNGTSGESIKLGKLVVMHANVPEEVSKLGSGRIGVLTGTSAMNFKTGDTIITHSLKKDAIRTFKNSGELNMRVNKIDIPPPVFSASIEPKTLGNKKEMDAALQQLSYEDPSLKITKDEETGQTLIHGMGELHLEIAKDRLINELNAQCTVGNVMVSYKESIDSASEKFTKVSESGCKLTISVKPTEGSTSENTLRESSETVYSLMGDNNYLIIKDKKHAATAEENRWPYENISIDAFHNAIFSSCIVALQKGGKVAGFPLHSVTITVEDDWELPLDIENVSSLLPLSRSLIYQALDSIQDYVALQPTMNVKINVSEKDLGAVMQDLSSARKAVILSIDENTNNDGSLSDDGLEFYKMAEDQYLPPDYTLRNGIGDTAAVNADKAKTINALVPLKEMVAYLNRLRSLTQGRGSFHMEYHGMERITPDVLESIINASY
ncbi:hypothetical protein ACO0QE_004117 [Hanseniaspora vineae]